jgi:hypothetical protein
MKRGFDLGQRFTPDKRYDKQDRASKDQRKIKKTGPKTRIRTRIRIRIKNTTGKMKNIEKITYKTTIRIRMQYHRLRQSSQGQETQRPQYDTIAKSRIRNATVQDRIR